MMPKRNKGNDIWDICPDRVKSENKGTSVTWTVYNGHR